MTPRPTSIRLTAVSVAALLFNLASAATQTRSNAESGNDPKANIANSQGNLQAIGMFLATASPPWRELVSATHDSSIAVAPADLVFIDAIRTLAIPEHVFVSLAYQREVQPKNSEGRNVLEQYGSSYDSWFMSLERWELAHHCPWQFPLLWDRKPELYGGKVTVLWIDMSRDTIPADQFAERLSSARRWLDAESVRVEDLLKQLESSSEDERQLALRFLGAGKHTNTVHIIGAHLNSQPEQVRLAAVWAMGWLGAPEGLRLLEPLRSDSNWSVRAETARALARIGLQSILEPIAELAKDAHKETRRQAMQALADLTSSGTLPALRRGLRDTDPSVRRIASQAISLLQQQEPYSNTKPACNDVR